jgi:diadenosine tetraphosphate (Ap4A) HIT family hydrolase
MNVTIPDTCELCNPTKGLVSRGELWTIVLNENQTLLGRCYFALNRHETDITRLSVDEETSLFDGFRVVKSALGTLFHPDHYNYVMLMNVAPHAHAHIIPRYIEPRRFGGREFVDGHFGDHYDPAEEALLAPEHFDDLAAQIRAALNSAEVVH